MVSEITYSLVFPGQGSQRVGMLAEIAEFFPLVKARFDQASAIVGYDLWSLAQQGPVERLAETQFTQPLVFTANIAIWDVWCSQVEEVPAVLAGHSLGEYSALVVGGALTFETGLRLVMARAEAMANAAPDGIGGMLAVLGLDRALLETLCAATAAETGLTVNCVNYNAPGQIVVGGHKKALGLVANDAKALGARRVLPVAMNVPSHSPLMKPAAEPFAAYVEDTLINVPKIDVIHNATLCPEHDVVKIKAVLVSQIYQPVNWVGIIERIAARGVTHIFECGPGKVLSGLNRRIKKGLMLHPLETLEGMALAKEAMFNKTHEAQ